jgi:hypothetical protein
MNYGIGGTISGHVDSSGEDHMPERETDKFDKTFGISNQNVPKSLTFLVPIIDFS